MKYQRKRNQTLTIRLTAEEKDLLTRKAEELKTSVTDYILLAALRGETELSATAKLLLERLADIGNTLEKIRTEPYPPDYYDVLRTQDEMRQELFRLVRTA